MKKSTVSTIAIIFEFIILLLFVVSLVTFIAYSTIDRREAFGREAYDANPSHYENLTNFIVFLFLFLTIYFFLTAIVTIVSAVKINHSVNKNEFKANTILCLIFGVFIGILMLTIDENSLIEKED